MSALAMGDVKLWGAAEGEGQALVEGLYPTPGTPPYVEKEESILLLFAGIFVFLDLAMLAGTSGKMVGIAPFFRTVMKPLVS